MLRHLLVPTCCLEPMAGEGWRSMSQQIVRAGEAEEALTGCPVVTEGSGRGLGPSQGCALYFGGHVENSAKK